MKHDSPLRVSGCKWFVLPLILHSLPLFTTFYHLYGYSKLFSKKKQVGIRVFFRKGVISFHNKKYLRKAFFPPGSIVVLCGILLLFTLEDPGLKRLQSLLFTAIQNLPV